MKNKSLVEKAKESATEIVATQRDAATSQQCFVQLWQTIGGIKLADALANSLNVQLLRALEGVKEQKLYRDAGYSTFDEFLDTDPNSPMRYEKYRERINLLNAEGDATFDFLNSLAVPLSARKLLTEGVVTVDGDTITVGLESARIDDRARITEIIRTLASKTAEQTRTIERGKKEHDNLKRKLDEAKRTAAPLDSQAHPFGQALLATIGAYARLVTEARALSEEESDGMRGKAMELLAAQRRELEEAFRFDGVPLGTSNELTITDADLDDIAGEM